MSAADNPIEQAQAAAEEVADQIEDIKAEIGEKQEELAHTDDEDEKTWIRQEIISLKTTLTEMSELLKSQQSTIRDLTRQLTKAQAQAKPKTPPAELTPPADADGNGQAPAEAPAVRQPKNWI